jgi:hypothetical protein
MFGLDFESAGNGGKKGASDANLDSGVGRIVTYVVVISKCDSIPVIIYLR